jgi:hypothetical protein
MVAVAKSRRGDRGARVVHWAGRGEGAVSLAVGSRQFGSIGSLLFFNNLEEAQQSVLDA